MASSNIEFVGRDYTTVLERLQAALVQEVPELTDLNYSDAGQFLLRRLASEIDYLHFYLDEAFYENFIQTAEHRQSLINLAKLVGWNILIRSAAQSTVRLTRINGITGDVTIPAYSIFTKTDSTPYISVGSFGEELEYVLLDGQDTIDIQVIQGFRQTYTIRDDEFTVDTNTGLLKFDIGDDVASGTVSVISGDDLVEWEQVDSFWRSTSSDLHYMIDFESDPENPDTETCFLVLGPCGFPTGDTFNVYYTRTLGLAGNTGIGTINTVSGTLANSVTCSNITIATGGSDIESVTSFKGRIPEAVRTQRRGVVSDDYKAIVESISGVRFCQVADRNTLTDFPHLYVKLYVVPYGGLTISEQLRNEILDEIESKGSLGPWSGRYIISEASPYEVAITARVGISSGHNPTTVVNNFTSWLSTYLNTFDIAETLDFSNLNVYSGRQTGINWIEFDSPNSDLTIPTGYIIQPGTISITIQ